ncbi:YdaU family protein [Duganella dendranthematis]|uniref:YdaU family protein n=1 Tax=Duganella dendranthematis TaxID=2728021 RepID=A0ABX6MFT2_9BURK|nr:YdaU family protein [Duganella dendranthematis]QJD91787.1 YdaU family protein [Duganella dendranthematis]
MNYYPHHIGDFNSSTRHLTRMERGIFRDMLDLYYEKERPLPADERTLFRRLLVISPEEVEAAQQVLADFFTLTDEGWFNERCAAVIADYHANLKAAAAGGRARAWAAEEKRLRADIKVGDIVSAERRLLEFVERFDDSPETVAMTELLASLKRPPQTGFDFEPVKNRDATAIDARYNPGSDVIEPQANRDATAIDPRLSNAEANQNQNQNHNQNQVNTPTPSTQSEDPARGAVALSIEFRKHGVKTQPADPRLLEMASQGVTAETVAAACEEAKRTKPDGLNLGYVKGILERWSREAATISVAGARPQGRQPVGGVTAARAATIAGLTGGGVHGAAGYIIDIDTPTAAHQLG